MHPKPALIHPTRLMGAAVARVCLLSLYLCLDWPLACAQEIVSLGFPASIILVDPLHPDTCLLAGGHSLARYRISAHELELRHEFEARTVHAMATIPDANLSIAGTADGEHGWVGCFDTAHMSTPKWVVEMEHPITSLSAVDGRVLASNDSGEIAALDVRNGQLLWTQQLHSKLVTCMTKLSDDLCASADWTGKIVLFEISTGIEQANFQQHRDRITALVSDSSAGQLRLYSASRDGTVRLWYPKQGRLVRFVQLEEPISAMCIIRNSLVAAATRDAQVHLIDMDSAKEIVVFPSGLEYVTSLACTDGEHLLALDGKSTGCRIELNKLWNDR